MNINVNLCDDSYHHILWTGDIYVGYSKNKANFYFSQKYLFIHQYLYCPLIK